MSPVAGTTVAGLAICRISFGQVVENDLEGIPSADSDRNDILHNFCGNVTIESIIK